MQGISGIIFIALAFGCGYGLLASFEPGVGISWKIGYGSFAGLFLVLGIYSFVKQTK